MVNRAFEVEDGDSGVAYKKRPRFLHPFDEQMDQRYANGQVLIAINSEEKVVGCIVWHI